MYNDFTESLSLIKKDDETFVALVRGCIALNRIKKQDIAKRVGLSPDALSKVLHSRMRLKPEIKEKLFTEILKLL